MKVYIEHEVPQGLGKKSIIVLPFDDSQSLVVSVPYNDDFPRAWAELVFGSPPPEDDLEEDLSPNDLFNEILTSCKDSHNVHNVLSEEMTRRLRELVAKQRGVLIET